MDISQLLRTSNCCGALAASTLQQENKRAAAVKPAALRNVVNAREAHLPGGARLEWRSC